MSMLNLPQSNRQSICLYSSISRADRYGKRCCVCSERGNGACNI